MSDAVYVFNCISSCYVGFLNDLSLLDKSMCWVGSNFFLCGIRDGCTDRDICVYGL